MVTATQVPGAADKSEEKKKLFQRNKAALAET